MKRGFTLHELLISLTMMIVVFTLATHFAVKHLRFSRISGDVVMQSAQLLQVSEILRNVLANVSPSGGELLVAEDSVVELRVTTGIAFSCIATPGQAVVAVPDASLGGVASAFARPPALGDRLSALFSDSTGATWLHFEVAASPESAGPCSFNPSIDATWVVATKEPMSLPPGTPLRFTRPFRFSLYRSSDNRWHLGAKDWNGSAQRFNAIQPVAGPFLRYEADSSSGLRFDYHDALGHELVEPFDLSRIASVSVVARTATDSMVNVVRLRNAR
jgi:hypothetical protein